MVTQFGDIKIMRLQRDDIPQLVEWLTNSEVLKYYEGRDKTFDTERVEHKFFNRSNDQVKRCMIEMEGQKIGYIQFYPIKLIEKEKWGYVDQEIVFGMDQFIGETRYWNQGIGAKIIKGMIDYLVIKEQANRIILTPRTQNYRAICCYEKCGFQKVKKLLKYEYYEEEWHDCWLMEYKS